ncbi:conserved hypothetical protein, unlikely [Trypanosoma brucei gambiense DAL972]|uniref:Uncharacterized protein n=2 Tax=Trypanosoma brucei TaxID=5691 RepID=C9ZZE4_TRYB9|nr:conserved hypothetical protein, unlikely [Trypanosoma brucei gambiense DAL972]RHW70424.1 hypothetical protein DPX39_090083800 [Trypanosoma brucei equiperdum]CBH14793.1 conserved hypothetical protein, unlikely [Trypanosoma brucei gambiense DAL972]|eukprot:XP_011777059.1 conserved hypothetical protein, unlikely [Trypanosoma brucei gambiense DAL972]
MYPSQCDIITLLQTKRNSTEEIYKRLKDVKTGRGAGSERRHIQWYKWRVQVQFMSEEKPPRPRQLAQKQPLDTEENRHGVGHHLNSLMPFSFLASLKSSLNQRLSESSMVHVMNAVQAR